MEAILEVRMAEEALETSYISKVVISRHRDRTESSRGMFRSQQGGLTGPAKKTVWTDRQGMECWCSLLGELDCPLSPLYLGGKGFSQVRNSRQAPGSGAGRLLALGLGQRWESQEVGRPYPVGRDKDTVTH